MTKQTFTNTINYTQQTAGRKYTSFQTPLTSNKILFYITSLQIYATGRDIIWGYYPVDLKVSYSILTTSTYSLSATLSVYV